MFFTNKIYIKNKVMNYKLLFNVDIFYSMSYNNSTHLKNLFSVLFNHKPS